jgi:hypothetical protein
LCSVIFGLMPFGWLGTSTLVGEYESHGAEHNWEAVDSLQTTSVTMCLPCSLYQMVNSHLFNSFAFVLLTNATPSREKGGWGNNEV